MKDAAYPSMILEEDEARDTVFISEMDCTVAIASTTIVAMHDSDVLIMLECLLRDFSRRG